jgi:hypothetical protein
MMLMTRSLTRSSRYQLKLICNETRIFLCCSEINVLDDLLVTFCSADDVESLTSLFRTVNRIWPRQGLLDI